MDVILVLLGIWLVYCGLKAEIYEYHKPKYETTDLFFIWRQL